MDREGEYKHLRLPESRLSTYNKIPRRYFGAVYDFSQDDMETFSETLITGLDSAIKSNESYEIQTIPYILKIKTREELTSADRQKIEKLGLQWLNPISPYSVIVSLPKRKRDEILVKIKEYGRTGKFRSYFNSFAQIEIVSPEEKLSKEIERVSDENTFWIDVEFYSGLNLEDYFTSIEYITKIVNKDSVLRSKVDDPEIPFIRIKTTRANAYKIANTLCSVRKIDKVPSIKAVTDTQLRRTQEVVFESARDDLEKVMVIDCGINSEHPGIRNVLITKKTYIPSADTSDKDGHGTKVAGLAAYGVFPSSGVLRPTSKIGVAKIHEGEDGSEIETILEEIVRDGVSKSIRVYSLTVLYYSHVSDEITKVAYEIDKLSREYDILFIISSGNLDPDQLRAFRSLGLTYPRYFQEMSSRILHGAEAACGLTIGGIAGSENASSIARKHQASPFTRAGPTPDGRLKPELVHFAGNMDQSFECLEELGIISLSNKPDDEFFSFDHGTSFSAPVVANMASQILVDYPSATSNLVRALLAHNAKIDDDMRNLSEPRFVYGFGFPVIERTLRSTPFSPTLIFEGNVESDKIAQVKIPVPKEMGLSKGSKLMRVTLAYDPPVSRRNQAISYTGIDLRFDLLRKNKTGEYVKVGGTDKSWQTPYYRAEKNTIKKDTFQWERGHVGEEWIVQVTPTIRDYTYKGKKQRFALVVSLEELSKAIDLYTPISKLLEEEMVAKQVMKVPLLRPQRIYPRIKK